LAEEGIRVNNRVNPMICEEVLAENGVTVQEVGIYRLRVNPVCARIVWPGLIKGPLHPLIIRYG